MKEGVVVSVDIDVAVEVGVGLGSCTVDVVEESETMFDSDNAIGPGGTSIETKVGLEAALEVEATAGVGSFELNAGPE